MRVNKIVLPPPGPYTPDGSGRVVALLQWRGPRSGSAVSLEVIMGHQTVTTEDVLAAGETWAKQVIDLEGDDSMRVIVSLLEAGGYSLSQYASVPPVTVGPMLGELMRLLFKLSNVRSEGLYELAKPKLKKHGNLSTSKPDVKKAEEVERLRESGMTIREIAQRTGKYVRTVEQRLYRSRRRKREKKV